MRFEAKHREGKITARAAISRVNICKTIAIKHQLRQNYRFLINKTMEKISYDSKLIKNIPIIGLKRYFVLFESLKISINKLKNIDTLRRVEFDGNTIEINTIIMILSEDGPIFYVTDSIIVGAPIQLYIIVRKLHSVSLHEHTECYSLYGEQYSWEVLDLNNLFSYNIRHLVRASNGVKFIVKKWLLLK